MELSNFQKRDARYIWHPLTQHKLTPYTIPIVKTEGNLLLDEHGKTYIDAIASWYTCMYGHCNSTIIQALVDQLNTLDQIVFTGFTHPAAINFSELLHSILPKSHEKIFFSDNGSTSVEVALKMSIQAQRQTNKKKANVLFCLENGFHGDTLGAMSASNISIYNNPFEDFFIEVVRLPIPTKKNKEILFTKVHEYLKIKNVFAFIYEPLIQGAAGMKFHDSEILDELLYTLQQEGIFLIADEVMTGLGKTGKYFASDYLKIKPDFLCLAKSLTGGISPMAVTTCSKKIFQSFYSDDMYQSFNHAHTYSGNALGCRAATECLKLLTSKDYQEKIYSISRMHEEFKREIISFSGIKNIRSIGVILAFEYSLKPLRRYGKESKNWYSFFLNKGIFLRPLGNTIYLLPPFTIKKDELLYIYRTIIDGLHEIKKQGLF